MRITQSNVTLTGTRFADNSVLTTYDNAANASAGGGAVWIAGPDTRVRTQAVWCFMDGFRI